jgi:hypothetical protein
VRLPGIRRDSGADESHRLIFGGVKQRRHIANLKRVLTSGPHGLKVWPIEQKRGRQELLG